MTAFQQPAKPQLWGWRHPAALIGRRPKLIDKRRINHFALLLNINTSQLVQVEIGGNHAMDSNRFRYHIRERVTIPWASPFIPLEASVMCFCANEIRTWENQ
jgi:hypothetical protein